MLMTRKQAEKWLDNSEGDNTMQMDIMVSNVTITRKCISMLSLENG